MAVIYTQNAGLALFFYQHLRKLKPFAFPGDDRTGILMNNHIRPWKTPQNRLLYLFSHQMRLNEREIIFHFQMNLNKAGRP